jgi:uncharacterized protein YndB with AHSA1/START domain
MANKITIQATVNAPANKVWEMWTNPQHIVQWNNPSPDWHTPRAEHELTAGGKFNFRMEAKDGSFGFDFGGVYDVVTPNKYLEYTIGDGRKVKIDFASTGNTTHITEEFEAETVNPEEMQRSGWQAILDNFKKYTEAN